MSNIYSEKYERVCGIDTPIHWSVTFGEHVKIGENVVIDAGCKIGSNVFIGHNTVVRSNVEIGNDSIIGHLVMIEANTVIGHDTTIQSQCHITKNAIIGNHIFFGPTATVINTHRISHGRDYDAKLLVTTVKDWARIGTGSICMPGVTIGKNAHLAAGAVATKDVPDCEIWAGVPAKYIKNTPKDEIV